MDKILKKYFDIYLPDMEIKKDVPYKLVKGTFHYKLFVLSYYLNEIKEEIFNIIFRRK